MSESELRYERKALLTSLLGAAEVLALVGGTVLVFATTGALASLVVLALVVVGMAALWLGGF